MRHGVGLGVLVLLVAPAAAPAQTATGTLSVILGSQARLSFSSTAITFPDADPDLVPLVPAAQGPVTVTAKARATRHSQVLLTLQSADDLRSGTTVLPASLITWNATGSGFVNGTLSRTAQQVVGAWTGSGIRSGTQSFRFENRWTHPAGLYSVTLVYTLSAP